MRLGPLQPKALALLHVVLVLLGGTPVCWCHGLAHGHGGHDHGASEAHQDEDGHHAETAAHQEESPSSEEHGDEADSDHHLGDHPSSSEHSDDHPEGEECECLPAVLEPPAKIQTGASSGSTPLSLGIAIGATTRLEIARPMGPRLLRERFRPPPQGPIHLRLCVFLC